MRIISGKYKGRAINPPRNLRARPTTDFAKENLFNVLDNLVDFEECDVLDLFAGTGAISIEFLSRECATVTSVEKAATQWRFIDQVARQLNIGNMNLVRGDVFRFISSCKQTFDIIFADPPYTLPNLGDIPALILESKMVKPGTLVVVEHSKAYDFSQLPGFFDRRVYGSVNFSLFRVGMP